MLADQISFKRWVRKHQKPKTSKIASSRFAWNSRIQFDRVWKSINVQSVDSRVTDDTLQLSLPQEDFVIQIKFLPSSLLQKNRDS